MPAVGVGHRVKLVSWATNPASGWDARLWSLWALYTALAYTIILAIVWLLTSLGLDRPRLAAGHPALAALLLATAGAALYSGVTGALQWRVLRRRIPIARRAWVSATVIPALIVWIAVVVPAGLAAGNGGQDLQVAYLLAVSQSLAFGPLVGFGQARAFKPYTDRWPWWIAANLVSYVIVDAIFYVVSLIFGSFDFAHGKGSPTEAYIVLLVTTPLSARWMLWVIAPPAIRH